jgi:tetratricopeptide (TPR) repeat protein
MGSVLKGRDPDLGRDLAVKVLLEAHRDRPELVRRFVEEAQIAGQLQHPGVVPVYELGTFPDRRPYFTMKLVRGRTLAGLLDERPDPGHDRPRFLGVFEQVCQTMAYAHAHKVIHRDLKPSNVMVGAFGEVQVMDWGLAKVLAAGGEGDEIGDLLGEETLIQTARSGSDADASQAGSVMGTPSYMAPEQARGEVKAVDERSDVFALGAILCEILTGRPPYVGPTPSSVLRLAARADLADAFGRLSSCDADVALLDLTRRCLAPDPADRFPDAVHVAREVTAYLAGVQERLRAAELARVGAQARAEEERKRRKTELRLAAGILAVLVVGTLGVASQWLRAETHLAAVTVANSKLTEANALVIRSRDEALARRDLALEAIDTFTTGASKDLILKEPQLASLRGKLLGSALAFYRKLQTRLEADPGGSPAELADGYSRLATVTREIGQLGDALKVFERELPIRERLAREGTDDLPRQLALRNTQAHIGVLLSETGRAKEALRLLESETESWGRLARAHPDDVAVETGLADSHIDLAALLDDHLGRFNEATRHLELAEGVLDRLTRRHPESYKARRVRAVVQLNLAICENDSGRTDNALWRCEKSEAILEPLIHELPDDLDVRSAIGHVQDRHGALLTTLGRTAEALTHLKSSVSTWERLASDQPNVTEFQLRLTMAYIHLADLWGNVNRPADALKELKKSVDITARLTREHTEALEYRVMLSNSRRSIGFMLRNLGRHEEAVTECEQALAILEGISREHRENPKLQDGIALCHVQLASLHALMNRPGDSEQEYRRAAMHYEKVASPDASSLYNQACVHARISALIALSPTGGVPDVRIEAAQHADRAVKTLGRAVAAGLRDASMIRADADFEALRVRPDFQLLLLDAAFPSDPFTR